MESVIRRFTRRPELKVCLLLLLILAAVWAFAEIADEVMEGDTKEFDRRILLAMRTTSDLSDPVGPPWAEELWRDFSALGGLGLLSLLTLITAGYLYLTGKQQLALFLITVSISACIITFGLKEVFDRERPDVLTYGSHVYTTSFPSGHSMMSTSIYLTLGVLLAHGEKRARVKVFLLGCATLLSVLVGGSRVYLGVHWPTDVLAGWIAGAAWAVALTLVLRWMRRERRRSNTGPGEPQA